MRRHYYTITRAALLKPGDWIAVWRKPFVRTRMVKGVGRWNDQTETVPGRWDHWCVTEVRWFGRSRVLVFLERSRPDDRKESIMYSLRPDEYRGVLHGLAANEVIDDEI